MKRPNCVAANSFGVAVDRAPGTVSFRQCVFRGGLGLHLTHSRSFVGSLAPGPRDRRTAEQRDELGDAPDFVEVGEAGITGDDVMRRQCRVQLVG